MTQTDGDSQELADRIAARGREALVERLRKAYADAAATHADIVSLDHDRIEAMVQAAADRADGLQWRRALANVAAQELGLSLPEALSHPAVVRAQELVGAPSYEASVAELIARPVPPRPEAVPETTPVVHTPAAVPPAPAVVPVPEPLAPEPVAPAEPQDQLEAVEADDELVELLPEPVVEDPEQPPAADAPLIDEDPSPPPAQPERVIDEPELHGATDELEAVEVDDELVELLPPPEPVQYEVDPVLSPPAPEPDQVLNAEEPPPVVEQVPFEPEPEETPDAEAEPPAVSPADYLDEPTQVHVLEDTLTPISPSAATDATDLPPDNGFTPDAQDISQFTDLSSRNFDGPLPGEDWAGEALDAENHDADYVAEHTDYPPADADELHMTAYHLGGVANLPTGRDGLELRLSEHGLDILQPTGEIIGRLHWSEIDTLEVTSVRGRLRRQARAQARIIVRTKHGDASFEIPGVTGEELQERVDPLVSRFSAS